MMEATTKLVRLTDGNVITALPLQVDSTAIDIVNALAKM